MKDGKQLKRRLIDSSGLLSQELMGSQYGSLTIISNIVHGSSDRLKVEVICQRCHKTHMALFHNIRKRPETKACPHCNGRKPIKVPKWLYQRCQAQQDRCQNSQTSSYERYGARGIQFKFKSPNEAATWIWENLGSADRSMQLDRIDNNGHYEAGNLRWTDAVVNLNNTRKSKGARQRFILFRKAHPEVKYADATLRRYIYLGMTDQQILERWMQPSYKPKGKYGTLSMLGLYKDSPLMGD